MCLRVPIPAQSLARSSDLFSGYEKLVEGGRHIWNGLFTWIGVMRL